MRPVDLAIATSLSWFSLFAAACEEEPPLSPSGLPYCWTYDCPTDPAAEVCGACKNPGRDRECPPGFVCSCNSECVKGPRSYDAIPSCEADAGGLPSPDAQTYVWPACDEAHLPGT